jgi:hypothetical protein
LAVNSVISGNWASSLKDENSSLFRRGWSQAILLRYGCNVKLPNLTVDWQLELGFPMLQKYLMEERQECSSVNSLDRRPLPEEYRLSTHYVGETKCLRNPIILLQ